MHEISFFFPQFLGNGILHISWFYLTMLTVKWTMLCFFSKGMKREHFLFAGIYHDNISTICALVWCTCCIYCTWMYIVYIGSLCMNGLFDFETCSLLPFQQTMKDSWTFYLSGSCWRSFWHMPTAHVLEMSVINTYLSSTFFVNNSFKGENDVKC